MKDFASNLRYGQQGEQMVAMWCEVRGYHTTFIGGGGDPRFKTPSMARRDRNGTHREAMPDLQVYKDKRPANIEVKTKRQDVFYQKASEWRQGIQERLFNGYKVVQDTSGIDTFLAFVVLTPEPVKLRIQSITLLDQYGVRQVMENERHIFWRTDIFETWQIEDNQLKQMLPGAQPRNVQYPWDRPAPAKNLKQEYFDFGGTGPRYSIGK